MKAGLELEYWTVDGNGELVSCRELADSFDFSEQEFVEPLFEIKTGPRSDPEELIDSVREKIERSVEKAEELGLHIVPLGTPLNSGEIEAVDSERGRIQQEIIGEDLRAAERVAGTHVHFEKEDVAEQLNRLTAIDPALALMNSSPYYQGERLGSSSRNLVYRYRCYSEFPGHGQLWSFVDSVEEWDRRIDERFREWISAAEKEGIDRETVREHFRPEDALWTPVRLRKQFPTVEWRSPDTSLPSNLFQLVRDLFRVMESDVELPEFEELKDLSREAMEDGLTREVRGYLEDAGFETDSYRIYAEEVAGEEEIGIEEARKKRLDAARELREDLGLGQFP
ncbi:MAG: glutamate-cysteine ligase family protein [Candidatus Nanohaloarchaea archaeon]